MSRPGTSHGFRWLHDSFGTNARMLEIQAVIGRIQLRNLPAWSKRRRQLAQKIWDTAASLPGLRVPVMPEDIQHAAYKCYVFTDHTQLKPDWGRDRILEALLARGVPCYTGACPEIYRENAFDGTGFRPACRLPGAELLGKNALMFLVHPTLTDEDIDTCCMALRDVLQEAGGRSPVPGAPLSRPTLQAIQ